MYSWLVDLHLEEYLPLFLSAGYDMRTVSKMTPEVSYYFLIKTDIKRTKQIYFIKLFTVQSLNLNYLN